VQSAASAAFTFSELANSPLNAQVGTTYTLALTDQSKTVTMNNASANTCSIPTNASVAFHIGAKLVVRQIGAGLTTVDGPGVTIVKASATSLAMAGAQEQLMLHKTATDTWHVAPMHPAGGGASVSGAFLERTAGLSAGTSTVVTFPTEVYDDNGFGAGGTTDRVTVPTGVTRANLSGFMQGTGNTANSPQQMVINQYDVSDVFIRAVGANDFETGDTSPRINVAAFGVPCVATDYFQMSVSGGDASWTISAAHMSIQDVTP
jgi:hypothetical protein